jgi:hypothetical protein
VNEPGAELRSVATPVGGELVPLLTCTVQLTEDPIDTGPAAHPTVVLVADGCAGAIAMCSAPLTEIGVPGVPVASVIGTTPSESIT